MFLLLISGAAFSQAASIASADTQDFSALSALKNGQRIRVVSTSQGKLIGEFAELRGDTLLLRAGSSAPTRRETLLQSARLPGQYQARLQAQRWPA
ncbi:hypothetical protein DCC62_06455 [candidate division KSB1 bacterium]|nr:MAG: hypothetical protein DCC62_06455 [candidate division KSB1 bacterium]